MRGPAPAEPAIRPESPMPDVTDLPGLMLDCVQDLYAGELQAVAAYPRIVGAITAPALAAALDAHAHETLEQARRLERIAALLDASPAGPENIAVKGLFDDAARDIEMVAPGPLLDTALIGALRKVEHAEAVSYETALAVARALGLAEAIPLLERTHREEQAMDGRLLAFLADALAGPGAGRGTTIPVR